MTTTIGGSYPAVNSDSDATINGLTVGKGGGAVASNTVLGYQAAATITTGSASDYFGYQSGYSVTSANQNAAFGYKTLTVTTTGSNNSAFGSQAMQSNTTGANNTAIGFNALLSNTTASNNTAVGYQAGYSNTGGAGSTYIGYQSGYSNTANFVTAVGQSALYTNTGAGNTAFGRVAGYSVTSGTYNTILGHQAGYSLTTGSFNTFVGAQNSVGEGCGGSITTGAKNTILGGYSGNGGGLDIRTASNYIVLSDGDGNPAAYWNGGSTWTLRNPSGRYSQLNLQIGSTVGVQTYTDNVANAYYVIAGASGGVFLANTGVNWTSTSDERLKNLTGEIQNGLEKVCSLRAAEFTWKSDAEAKPQVGLIAQDVQAVLPEAVSTTVLKDDPTETVYLGVQYSETIPLLVAAIKELKAEFDAYKASHP